MIKIIALTLILLSCRQVPESIIELSEVKSIEIRINLPGDTTRSEPIRLSKNKIEEIVKGWNNAEPQGLCKFWPKYMMTIHMTDKRIRKFRLTTNSIKESAEECYQLEDGLVEKILEGSKASVPQ